MNNLQDSFHKDFTCIHKLLQFLSYETFIQVFTKKFYEDLGQVIKVNKNK